MTNHDRGAGKTQSNFLATEREPSPGPRISLLREVAHPQHANTPTSTPLRRGFSRVAAQRLHRRTSTRECPRRDGLNEPPGGMLCASKF
jgi:hypothetical protein